MKLSLDNKIVVVVGGSRGIGLSIVTKFLQENAIVHMISRNGNIKSEKTLSELYPNSTFFYRSDATDELKLKECCSEILRRTNGEIDVLIANVGNGSNPNYAINNHDFWKNSWDINFETSLKTARVFSPSIKNGSIIFISSICGIEYVAAPTDYSVAKAALISFSKILSHKLAPNIRVNVVAPGNILTEDGTWDKKLKENSDTVTKMLNERVPLKRLGTPDEIADTVLFLASKPASFITGSCIVVDGGQTVSY
jgi:3-oxoacyl-[acyl-carrier protein] reductase